MERPAPLARLSREFDAFLFSSIGDDRNGIPLSVVSLLARRDLDPWVAAASLTNLPTEAAAQKLTSWIRTIADPLSALPDVDAMATRLVALLPRRLDADIQSLAKPADFTAITTATAPKHQQAIAAAILVAIYAILMIGSQLFLSHHSPLTQATTTTTTTSVPIIPGHSATDALPPSAK
jgi:hypothetical protein